MKILSIDIGIKNLAFCLFNNKKVEKWDVIDLTKDDNFVIPTCCAPIESKKKSAPEENIIICNKKAIFQHGNKCYCKKHAKKEDNLMLCPPNLKASSLKASTVKDLKALATTLKVEIPLSCKKETILQKLNEYRDANCLETIKPVKKVNCSKVDLVTIGKAIKEKFDQVFNSDKIDCILIENQISPIANRMKTIQGMVSQYFIMKETCDQIEFVNAGNKLKKFNKENQTTYKDRKQLGISKCMEELQKEEENKHLTTFFEQHKKKDDLSDCFLQGLWYLEKK